MQGRGESCFLSSVTITAGEVEAFVDFPLPLKLGPCQSDKDWLLGGPGLFFLRGGKPAPKHSFSSCSVDTHFVVLQPSAAGSHVFLKRPVLPPTCLLCQL